SRRVTIDYAGCADQGAKYVWVDVVLLSFYAVTVVCFLLFLAREYAKNPEKVTKSNAIVQAVGAVMVSCVLRMAYHVNIQSVVGKDLSQWTAAHLQQYVVANILLEWMYLLTNGLALGVFIGTLVTMYSGRNLYEPITLNSIEYDPGSLLKLVRVTIIVTNTLGVFLWCFLGVPTSIDSYTTFRYLAFAPYAIATTSVSPLVVWVFGTKVIRLVKDGIVKMNPGQARDKAQEMFGFLQVAVYMSFLTYCFAGWYFVVLTFTFGRSIDMPPWGKLVVDMTFATITFWFNILLHFFHPKGARKIPTNVKLLWLENDTRLISPNTRYKTYANSGDMLGSSQEPSQ
ncbi:hypothetical protein HDU91_005921, partial [Kappamyces sp. JEL0680]